jgi:acylphosphatase
MQRREVRYRGRVQGVGFRYTARQIAGRFPVVGFVENQPDGSVLLVAEGTADALDGFLAAVGAEMAHTIHSADVVTQPATGGFDEFGVRL